MAEKYVLIAYASKYGSTAQIAENIALRLKKAGLMPVVRDVKEINSFAGYTAVVAGSAVYAGSWLKEAADFLEKFQEDLTRLPVWLFSAGPTGKGDPVEQMKGWRFPESLNPLVDTILPRDIAFFHGVLDMSRLRLAEKLIVYALKAPAGDFRDWEMINRWADQIAHSLKKEQA
jgi:menaquinone-dependent protoporphyrinogen oxidase